MLTIDVDPDEEAITRLRNGHELLPGEAAVELVPLGDGREFWIPRRFDLFDSGDDGRARWRMQICVHQGVPRCQRLIFEAAADNGEVRAGDLRELRVENMVELAAQYAARRVRLDGEGRTFIEPLGLEAVRKGITLPAVRRSRRVASRRVVTDDRLREVATIYRSSLNRNPTQAVQRRFGCAERTARLWVKRAREAGFLGGSIQGKAGEVT